MPVNGRDLVVRYLGDVKDLRRANREAKTQMRGFAKESQESGRQVEGASRRASKAWGRVGAGVKAGAVVAAGGAALLAKRAVQAASDAEQASGGVASVFKKNADTIYAESGRAAQGLGLAKTEYQSLATVLGAQLKNKGVKDWSKAGVDGVKDYTTATSRMLQTGADLSAQYGGTTKQAVEAISAVMRGETDPIERYGVSMSQAAIQAEGMALGLSKPVKNLHEIKAAQNRAIVSQRKYSAAVKEHGKNSDQALSAEGALARAQVALGKATAGSVAPLTAQEKALAAVSLLQKQTGDATGAFAREQDTLANKQQRAAAQWENISVKIGSFFLPIASKAMGFVADRALPVMDRWASKLADLGKVFSGEKSAAEVGPWAEKVMAGVTRAKEMVDGVDWSSIGGNLKAAFAGVDLGALADQFKALNLGEIFRSAKESAPALAPSLKLIGDGLAVVGRHADLVGKALPFLAAAFLVVKAAQSANNAIGKDSLVGFGLQLAASTSLAAANFALVRSQRQVAASTAGATVAENASLLTRARSAVATVAVTAAQKAAGAAAKVFAAGQWLVNAALTANPIGLVVVAIAALVGSLIYAYKHSETFRRIVNGALGAVKKYGGAALSWLGEKLGALGGWIKQTWLRFVRANVIILGALRDLKNGAIARLIALKDGFLARVNALQDGAQKKFTQLKDLALAPIRIMRREALERISSLREGARDRFDALRDLVQRKATQMKDRALTPFRILKSKALDTLRGLRDSAGELWQKISDKAKAPVRFVVNTVLENGLLKAGRTVANAVGLGKLADQLHVKLPKGFAGGGILPGASSWRHGDTMTIRARRGEGIYMSEVMKDPLERARLFAMNAAARAGRSLGKVRARFGGGYAGGGIVQPVNSPLTNRHSRAQYPWASFAGDFAVPTGTPVRSWKDGVVAMVKRLTTSYGQHVRVNHGDKTQSLYAHLSRILVTVGQAVKAGQMIGRSGSTGNSTGPHLHFETRGGAYSGSPGGGAADAGVPLIDVAGMIRDKITAPFKGLISQVSGSPFGQLAKGVAVKIKDGLIDKIKTANPIAAAGAAIKGAAGMAVKGAGAAAWTPAVLTALGMVRQPASLLPTVLRRMNQESGFNPRAINNWDINAKNGTPSKGLMQVIQPTFNAYAGKLRGLGIWNPIANIYASMRYALARYGSLASAYNRPGGYATGGIVGLSKAKVAAMPKLYDRGGWLPPGPSLVQNNTGKPEAVFTGDQFERLIAAMESGGRQVVVSADREGMRELIRVEVRELVRRELQNAGGRR